MTRNPFVTLVFRGKRFDAAAMPLEALPELAAYRDLVLAVAKAHYHEQNPDRQRLPKGFEEGFRLVLDRVDAGSAVPVVSRLRDESTLPFAADAAPGSDVFELARVIVERAIDSVSKRKKPPQEMTAELLARFNAFGRTLRDEESIVVAPPGKRDGAVYNRTVRRALVLRAQTTYEDDVDLVGEVRAADKDIDGFSLRLRDGRKVDVHTLPLFFRLALRSLDASALVRVRGSGLFDAAGSLLRVTLATDVSLAEEGDEGSTRAGCPSSIDSQIDSLKGLAPGWFDEATTAYDSAQLEWLGKLLHGVLEAFELPTPYVYPTPEGLARAEWSLRHWEIVANIDLTKKMVDVIAAHAESDEVHELPVALLEPGAESKFGRFLSEHIQSR